MFNICLIYDDFDAGQHMYGGNPIRGPGESIAFEF